MSSRPEETPPVSELLERAATGDQAAWHHLVEAFSGRLFALLYARCRDPELAEELATFMWDNRASLQAPLTSVEDAIAIARETDGLTVFSDAIGRKLNILKIFKL